MKYLLIFSVKLVVFDHYYDGNGEIVDCINESCLSEEYATDCAPDKLKGVIEIVKTHFQKYWKDYLEKKGTHDTVIVDISLTQVLPLG